MSSIRSFAARQGPMQPFNHRDGSARLFTVVAIKIKVAYTETARN